jgi:hypothetical protein
MSLENYSFFCGRFYPRSEKKSLFLIFLYISPMIFIVIKLERSGLKFIFAKIRVFCNIFNEILLSNKSDIMKRISLLQYFIIIILSPWMTVLSQDIPDTATIPDQVLDSLRNKGVILGDFQKKPEIALSLSQAVKFLQQRYQPHNWNNTSDPLRMAIGQLIFNASNPPLDSTEYLLRQFPYDSLSIPWDKFYIWEPMRIRIPVQTVQAEDVQNGPAVVRDTNVVLNETDSLLLPSVPAPRFKVVTVHKDTSIMVVIDTLHEVTSSYAGFPFKNFNYPYQSDSIEVAVKELLKYIDERDSSVVYFTGIDKQVTPVWLNSRSDKYVRYWLKNDLKDSVTVWIGNPARDTFGLYLEKEVTFRRPPKQGNYSDAWINVKEVDKSKLLEVQKVYIKPHYWKDRLEANFIMSQAALSNWVKGGENSLSTSMDITEYANYENKTLNLSSNNFFRIKLGFLKSGSNPVRKNLDLIETNSKLNHKAFGKFDFSGILLFKTQIAPGYNYNTEPDPTKVSKFFNPAILTVGFGLDYKPDKNTSLNFSPLSYKGTYMTDTTLDVTLYGIPRGKRSMNEAGISLLVTNEFKPVKSVVITNRLQLFTNYIDNPQNIDVDWEMIATASLNWFTDVRFNAHLIYDDDTKSPVIKDDKPVLNPDGTPKKTARVQFKEMLGLSVVFRF